MTTKHPKVEEALTAMKALGIPRETVIPVLTNLFRLYDRSWEFIEAENYRALADAIFEHKEDKVDLEDKVVAKVKREKTLNDETYGPSCKKLCTPRGEDKASEDTKGDIFAASSDGATAPPSQSLTIDKTMKPCSQLLKTGPLDKRHDDNANVKKTAERAPSSACAKTVVNGSISTHKRDKISQAKQVNEPSLMQERDKIPCANQVNGSNSTHGKDKVPRAKQVNGSRSTLERDKIPQAKQLNGSSSTHERDKIPRAKQNAEQGDASSTHFVKEIHPAQPKLLASFSPTCVAIESGSVRVDKDTKKNGSISKTPNDPRCKLDVDSSSSENVKVSLKHNSSLEQPNFLALDRDSIMKFMEEKLPRIEGTIGAPFCRKKFLEELCDCFLEIVSNSPKILSTGISSDLIKEDGRDAPFKAEQVNPSQHKKKPCYYIDDITKGEEKVKISMVDENGKGDRPSFYYIPKNLIYQNARINISLARISDDDCCASCSGDCLSAEVPCACARETGGVFAYTPDGLLKEELLKTYVSMNQEPEKHHLFYCKDCPVKTSKDEPCKGHLIRKFIKECWSKCGCDMRCGNRVVQRGISRSLQVSWTDDRKGWGVRTLEDLPVGAFVCEYVGEVLTNTELYERNLQNSIRNARHTYPVQLDADWSSESILKDEDLLCLDATFYGNVARFINHRCHDSNLFEVPVEVESLDHHYYHLAFFTRREVKAFEELTWDYQIDFDDHDHPIKAFQCCCGSAFCRDKTRKAKGKAKALR